MNFSNTSSPTSLDIWSCLVDWEGLCLPVISVFLMIFSVLGILLNVFVLMVFCLHKKSWTRAEIYLSNLAAADLLLVSFMPFWAAKIYYKYNWTFGLAMCKLMNMIFSMNDCGSIYFLVLVSIDRCLALVHPLTSEGIRRPKFAKLGCVMVWILGFIFSLPALIHSDLSLPDDNKTYCYMNYPSYTTELTNDISISVFGFIIPVLIISFCTFKMIKTLRKGLKEGVRGNKDDRKETTLVLAFILVLFIFCVPSYLTRIPYLLYDLHILHSQNSLEMLLPYSWIFNMLNTFKSVFNPVVYIILGENLQKKVAEFFRLRNPQRIITINETSTTTHLSRNAQSENDSL